jgi:hypothetical protein
MRHTDDPVLAVRVWPLLVARAVLVGVIATLGMSGTPASAARRALVIGNAEYARALDLPNPGNDARDVAARLAELGFEIAGGGPGLDLTREQMIDAVADFADSLVEGDLALFYFAGHGAQLAGENFLIPSDDGAITFAEDLRERAYSASFLLSRLEGRTGVTSLLILDACRNNPLGPRSRDLGGGAGAGLAGMDAPRGASSLIMFATGKGETASDGEGRNSRFTAALLEALKSPERRIEDIIIDIGARVRRESEGQQVPWSSYSLTAPIYLVPTEAPEREPEPEPEREIQPEPAVGLLADGAAVNGVISLENGFAPDPHRLSALADGEVAAAEADPSCRGVIRRRPSYVLEYAAGAYRLHLSAASDADTVLVVRDPSGAWSCSDDADGKNPVIDFAEPASGSYRIWVGLYDAGTGAAGAELSISEHGLLPAGSALYAYESVAAGFTPDPRRYPVRAGGSVFAQHARRDCVGIIGRRPDVVIDYAAGDYPLHFTATSEADTVLVIRDPSGAFACDDDTRGLDPAVSFARPAGGVYRIWVGLATSEPGGEAPPAELLMSEIEPQF